MPNNFHSLDLRMIPAPDLLHVMGHVIRIPSVAIEAEPMLDPAPRGSEFAVYVSIFKVIHV